MEGRPIAPLFPADLTPRCGGFRVPPGGGEKTIVLSKAISAITTAAVRPALRRGQQEHQEQQQGRSNCRDAGSRPAVYFLDSGLTRARRTSRSRVRPREAARGRVRPHAASRGVCGRVRPLEGSEGSLSIHIGNGIGSGEQYSLYAFANGPHCLALQVLKLSVENVCKEVILLPDFDPHTAGNVPINKIAFYDPKHLFRSISDMEENAPGENQDDLATRWLHGIHHISNGFASVKVKTMSS